jgi:hypothetical protein
MARRRRVRLSSARTHLKFAEEDEDQNDNENCSQCPRRGITPTRTMWPIRKCADEQEDQEDEDDCSEHNNALSFCCAPLRLFTKSNDNVLSRRRYESRNWRSKHFFVSI